MQPVGQDSVDQFGEANALASLVSQGLLENGKMIFRAVNGGEHTAQLSQ
jgi:hypothetical protein